MLVAMLMPPDGVWGRFYGCGEWLLDMATVNCPIVPGCRYPGWTASGVVSDVVNDPELTPGTTDCGDSYPQCSSNAYMAISGLKSADFSLPL